MRKVQAPKESPADPDRDFGTKYTHPAFGQISVTRASSTPGMVLYGTEFRHQNFLTLTISGSELHRNLSSDWYHSTDEIIEIAISEAQWARIQSSPNGEGIPCTLLHVERKLRPSIPYRKQEGVFREEAQQRVKEAQQRIGRTIKHIEEVVGKSLSGVKREELLEQLHLLERDLGDSLPFIMNQMEKHMTTVVEQAKVEVTNYMTRVVQETGLTALGGKLPLRLNSGDTPHEVSDEKETV